MPVKLRVAMLLAVVVLVTGAAFLVREFLREPPDVRGSVAPAGKQPGRGAEPSSPSSGKGEPAATSPPPSLSKPAAPIAERTPDSLLPVPLPPKSAPSTLPPASVPVAVNPVTVSEPMPAPRTASPAATAEQREATVMDLDKVTLMLRDFRSGMGENPTGTNAEIMKAVMGGNPKGARLGPPENQSLNAGGELVDRWGTPLFFHQMSKTNMEIRSAGPDRVMWTDDDILAH